MRRAVLAVLLSLSLAGVGGCGDDAKPAGGEDAAPPPIDAANSPDESDLDRPELPRPPTNGLPADLRPPKSQ